MQQFIEVTEENKDQFNKVVTHPLQSFEWGEFRKKTGVKVVRRAQVIDNKIVDGFTLTIHKVPNLPFNIGYLPKGNGPNKETLAELKRIGKENNCVFIQLEPNLTANSQFSTLNFQLRPAAHPLFTKYTFVLDLNKTEEELLKNMHPKTRYNIKVAQKHQVKIVEDNSEKGFNSYLFLLEETATRQKFYAHSPSYHKKMWEGLKNENRNGLSYHLFHAIFEGKIITSWVLFVFHDTLYYPYGASSRQNREIMASNLIAWEAILFGKKLGLKKFDMWGALGPDPDRNDPWYGFHKFKLGYGANLVEFVGSFDLVINPYVYEIYKIADKARWGFLRLRKLI